MFQKCNLLDKIFAVINVHKIMLCLLSSGLPGAKIGKSDIADFLQFFFKIVESLASSKTPEILNVSGLNELSR